MYMIGWLAATVILVVIEAATVGLTSIWLAGGALIAFLAALVGLPPAVQFGLFAGVSVLLMLFTRPVALRYINGRTHKTNIDSLEGQSARVTETVDNRAETGKVVLNGMDWTVRSLREEVIPEGETVIVREIRGVKLLVERRQPE